MNVNYKIGTLNNCENINSKILETKLKNTVEDKPVKGKTGYDKKYV